MEDLGSFGFCVEAPQRSRTFKSTHACSFMLPGLSVLPVSIKLHTQKWICLLISTWLWLCALNGPMITSILYTGKYFYLTRSWGMESQEEIGFRGPSADLSILPISQDIHKAIKVFIYNFSKRIILLWMTQYHKLPLILLYQRRYKEMKDEIQGITTRFRQLRVVERPEDLNSKEEALRLVIRRGRGPESWEDFCRSHSKQIAGLAQELSSPLSQFIV